MTQQGQRLKNCISDTHEKIIYADKAWYTFGCKGSLCVLTTSTAQAHKMRASVMAEYTTTVLVHTGSEETSL